MIPYELDPSLHAEPHEPTFDDGFSPPCARRAGGTHPVEPEEPMPGEEPAEPNPTRLPVEPEFGIQLPPAEPEKPGVKQPSI
jgi:hypothetical protein